MTDNVLNLQMVTRLDLPVDRVLDGAIEANLASAMFLAIRRMVSFISHPPMPLARICCGL